MDDSLSVLNLIILEKEGGGGKRRGRGRGGRKKEQKDIPRLTDASGAGTQRNYRI